MPGSFQLTPDMKYLITIGSSPGEGDSAIANTGDQSFMGLVPYTEYWSLKPTFIDALQGATGQFLLTLKGARFENPPTGFPVDGAYSTFILPTDVRWDAMERAPGEVLWLGPATGPDRTDSLVGIDFTRLVPPPTLTGSWSGTITWYVGSTSARQPTEPVVGVHTTTLSYSTVSISQAELRWFSATMKPEAPPST